MMCSTSGQFPYKKVKNLTALPPLPTGWDTDAMTGVRATILDYKMEATFWWWRATRQGSCVPDDCGATKPAIHWGLLSEGKKKDIHFGGMSFGHSSQADILNNRVALNAERELSGEESNHFKLGRSEKIIFLIFPTIQWGGKVLYWYLAAINVVNC